MAGAVNALPSLLAERSQVAAAAELAEAQARRIGELDREVAQAAERERAWQPVIEAAQRWVRKQPNDGVLYDAVVAMERALAPAPAQEGARDAGE
jgi:hypothetical protein